MRVLFWSGTFWPHIGGVEILAKRLLKDLRKRGYEFLVVTSKKSPDQEEVTRHDGIPVYRFSFRRNHSNMNQFIEGIVRVRQRVIKLKRAFAPELIHINAGGVSEFFHVVTADACRAPVLATLQGEWPKENNALLARTLSTADWVVGCSAFILSRGQHLLPEIISRSSVIYNGSSVPKLSPWPLPTKNPSLLCLGRLSPEKGFDVAITAFEFLIKSYPHVRLVIVGGGPEKSKLERQIAECGLADHIELAGEVSPKEIPSLLNAATVVMIPSRQEAFGLVALEAALMARPVVATRVGGLPEVVVHEETGLLVEPENPEKLADAAEYLLAHVKTATKMGLAAQARAQEIFGWQRYIDAYDTLYQQLTHESFVRNSKAAISSHGPEP